MIPHDDTFPCGTKNCTGTVSFHDGFWTCDTCDFQLNDEEMNGCDLFARHLLDQCHDLTPEELLRQIDEDEDDEETDLSL